MSAALRVHHPQRTLLAQSHVLRQAHLVDASQPDPGGQVLQLVKRYFPSDFRRTGLVRLNRSEAARDGDLIRRFVSVFGNLFPLRVVLVLRADDHGRGGRDLDP